MKTITLFLFLACSVFCLSAQQAEIEWQRTLGGTANDELRIIVNTSDGGFIAGGGSASGSSSTKSEASYGDYDYWVVKFDGAGNVEWENTIGGSGSDILNVIRETADNGFILGGTSFSGLSGEKTEAGIGSADYWILKLDNSGNIEWQNTIGGTGADDLLALNITDDGGYILGGHSSSPVSGDKTLAPYGPSGNADYWILKLTASGVIEWQKVYGGNNVDVCYSANQTADGGYILGGHSLSGSNGIKTDSNVGLYDYWVIKTDGAGNIEWQNGLGGKGYDLSRALIETSDGGYLIGGYSNSGATGDKNEPLIGIYDYWVIKLSATGSIEWQNTIGGTSDEYLFSLMETSDGSFLLGGYSYSGIGGDKIETTEGSADFWIVKLDALGSIASQEVIGAEDNEYLYSISQAPDGGYIIGGQSGSGISGDKTEDNLGGWDFWVVKLESTCIPSVETCNSLDDDCDGLVDDGIMESISIAANDTTTFCKGGKVTLTASYTGTSLQWQKNSVDIAGATGAVYSASTKGTYTCITTSLCGMATSNSILVTVNKKPTAEIIAAGPTTFCEGGSVVLSANSGSGLSYQWLKGSAILAGETSVNFTASAAGNYKCSVTKNSTGCSKNSNVITVSVPCKTGDKLMNSELLVYPNPASNFIIFEFEQLASENATLSIFNASGQLLHKLDASVTELRVTTEEIGNDGMYFYTLKMEDQQEIRGKFVIQR
jgi:hypothetical protein